MANVKDDSTVMDKYAERLERGASDKFFFRHLLEKHPDALLLDFACGNAFIGKLLQIEGWNDVQYVGYDHDPEILERSDLKDDPNYVLTTNPFVASDLSNNGRKKVLFLCSILHEVFPDKSTMHLIQQLVQHLQFDYVVVRDMYHTGANRKLTEMLLKIPYVGNFDNELNEDYFSWNDHCLKDWIGQDYKIIEDDKYLPHWIEKRILKQSSHYEFIKGVTTHRKTIYYLDKSD
jgi:SAM-dependent methyltransferase